MEEVQVWQAVGIFILCFGITGVTMALIHKMDQRSQRDPLERRGRRKRDK